MLLFNVTGWRIESKLPLIMLPALTSDQNLPMVNHFDTEDANGDIGAADAVNGVSLKRKRCQFCFD